MNCNRLKITQIERCFRIWLTERTNNEKGIVLHYMQHFIIFNIKEKLNAYNDICRYDCTAWVILKAPSY